MKFKSVRWLLLFLLLVQVVPVHGAEKLAKATFAGGCFWCMVPPFEKLAGVVAVTSGYTGGQKKNPTYEEVSSGGTGHAESIQVLYDPAKISYAQLLQTYWHNVDPTQADGQFCDHGNQYRSAIFYGTAEEKQLAEKSKMEVEKELKRPVVTQIVPASQFYAAEEYHQDFYKKNPVRYESYRLGCGRDRRLKELWGDAAGSH
ncbi:MAG TPA: peptide-methionine (S)-S-oxide reductase MsrA [Acidobacteriota bacterium]|nr:peptide-methionine (S)-S-oxide reductase MsrA [Acidobacteriota bacterium]